MKDVAWLIHKTESGDTSMHVLFFTREQGLIRALYKGGRQPKKQALLREFTPLWVDFNERRGWYYLRHLEIAAASLNLQHIHLFSALYLNELLYLTLSFQDPYPELYDNYVQSLQSIHEAPTQASLERVLRRFEWALLVSLGYAVSLTHEAYSALPIEASDYYAFKAGEGFIRQSRGILGAHILALAEDDLEHELVLKSAKYCMRQAIMHLLNGKKIKTRDLFKTYEL